MIDWLFGWLVGWWFTEILDESVRLSLQTIKVRCEDAQHSSPNMLDLEEDKSILGKDDEDEEMEENLLSHPSESESEAESEDDDTESEEAATSDEDYVEEDISASPSKGRAAVDLQYKRRAVDYWRSGKTKRMSLASVHRMFHHVVREDTLYQWEKQLLHGAGSRLDKLRAIADKTLASFQEARAKGYAYHCGTLRSID